MTRNSSVGVSLDSLSDAFILGPAADTVVTVEGGYSVALLWASGVAVLSALQFGFNLGNMNTAAEAMRLRLGVRHRSLGRVPVARRRLTSRLGTAPPPPRLRLRLRLGRMRWRHWLRLAEGLC